MTARLTLDVWLDGFDHPAGELAALESGDVQFRYSDQFLTRGHAISMSLPLDDAPVGDSKARAFFDNLLPENDQMQKVIDREGLERSDIVAILSHIGADCTGAISCLPVGTGPIKVPGDLAEDYRSVPMEEIERAVRSLANRESVDGFNDASPVAGVQRKIALTVLPDGNFAVPAAGKKVPATHILKVPRTAEASEAIQEDAATRLAMQCGFSTSHSRHVEIGGVDAVLIQRYDRIVENGVVYRRHQEDFAQALGLPANLKYQRHGAPGRQFDADAIFTVLQKMARPARAVEDFLLITMFNLAIGNNDNHAKNHGIIYDLDGRPDLAPFYDLLPIQISAKYTDQLAYDIGGASYFASLEAEDVYAFLAQFGLTGGRAKRFLDGRVRQMFEALEDNSGKLRPLGPPLRMFDDLVGRELSRLNDVLNLDLALKPRDYFGTQGGGWAAIS